MIAYLLSLLTLAMAAASEEAVSVLSLTQYVRITKTISAATHQATGLFANTTAPSNTTAPLNGTANTTAPSAPAQNHTSANSSSTGSPISSNASPLSNGVSHNSVNIAVVGAAVGAAALFI